MIIKQSTARTILVGPVLDSTGAAKTDEVVASIKVTKNGTVGAANGSATLTHDHAGKYKLALTATDCDTVGMLEISLNSGTNDMPIARLCVVEEAVYDAMFAASAAGYQVPIWASAASTVNLSATTVKTLTDAVALPASATIAITGNITGNISGSVGSVTGAVGSVTGNVGGSVASVVGLTASNLDATISSRMATYTQPTGFLAATFPGTVASPTNITAGTITTVGTLITLPAITTDWLTGTGVAASAVTKIQAGLSTYAGGDTSGTTTILTRLSSARAGYLDNLSAGAVMLASSYSAPPSAATIADAVWDEVQSGHTTTGTFGYYLDSQVSAAGGGSLTAADVWSYATRVLTAGTNIALAKGTGVTGFTDIDAAGIRTATGLASANLDTQLAAIVADTNELQTDWANGGRLDLIIDSRASQTSVDDLPTNAELTTALGTADDATLAAIAALSIPSAATNASAVRTELATELARIDVATSTRLATVGYTAPPSAASIATEIFTANMSSYEASAPEHSLCTVVLASLESSISGTTWTIKRTNGSTTHATKTVSKTAGDDPIRGVS